MTNQIVERDVASEDEDSAISFDGWLEPPQPRDLLLTVLGDYVRHRKDTIWSGGLVKVLGEFGFSAGAARVALSRMARRGLIVPQKRGRVVGYELSEQMERLLVGGEIDQFLQNAPQASVSEITVLLHTLPEEMRLERGRLARRLRFWGFGPVQDGVWVGLGDREEDVLGFLTDLGLGEYCSLVIGRLSENLQLASLVERAWDLNALNERYERYVEIFGALRVADARTDAEAFQIRTQALHNFRQFPSLDPGIEGPQFPVTAMRDETIRIFNEIYSGLEEPAVRYFDQITTIDKGVR
ncbi:PaaX family transcriptional regulator [Glutamicibacter uratoxydans]|uniref:PaaX family transcriptional regulator n=1 Tax=Glutamicibacter uratoxydans TaxID=43667 RepID=UPI003D6FFFBE